MTEPHPPAARGQAGRSRLAGDLKQARRAARLTQPQVAERVGRAQSWVSRVEASTLLPSAEDVQHLARIYGMEAATADALATLANGLREEQSTRVILRRGVAGMQRWIGELEATTTEIRSYEPCAVIGLVQTDDYARAIFSLPDFRLPPDQVSAAVEARAARRDLLSGRSDKSFTLVMTEGALRTQVGGPSVMEEQLERLADLALMTDGPALRLGLIPWTVIVDALTPSGFQVFDRDAVMIETELATLTPTGQADVDAYLHRFATLERLAVFGQQARPHFQRIAAEYRSLASAR